MTEIKDSFEKIFRDKNKILFVMAHPDDAEIYAGATIARLTSSGREIRIVKMTSGNRGSRQEEVSSTDLSELRVKEDSVAMKVLGIKPENSVFLDINDGEVDNSLSTIGKIAFQIREFKPDLVVTHNAEDMIIRFTKDENWVNHRDHRNTGKSTLDAAYPYSRDILFFSDQLKKVGSHIVSEFLFVDYYDHPDLVYIDVTGFTEVRARAIAAHSSQYSIEHAQISTDYFTKSEIYGDKRFERFRYVVAD